MINSILIVLYFLLAIVITYFIVWLSRNLLAVVQERDEWRILAVNANGKLQNLEQSLYYENEIAGHRDDRLRPLRTSTQINWGKAMTEWHSSQNLNQGEESNG